MSENFELKELNSLFLEINRGYSVIDVDEQKCYVKHSGLIDISEYNEIEKKFTKKAEDKGLMTKKDLLDFLDSEGLWSKKEESQIEANTNEIKNLKKTLSNLFLEDQKNNIQARIDEVYKELSELLETRNNLVKNTSEEYGEKKANEYFMFRSLFKDCDFKEMFFSQEEFEELTNKELGDLYQKYNNCLAKFSEKAIQQISISGHFSNIFSLYSADVSNFFKKHPLDLSFFQINLLNYAKLFGRIFENREIPDGIRDNASKILEHLESESKVKNRKEAIQNKANSSDGFSYVGAKSQDFENMGIKKKFSKDIHELAKEKGGTLSMEDFINFHKK